MPSEGVERRTARAHQMGVNLPPVDQDPLPCPRCESINTKFCYYNNYNFSQPRHFCKSCRRYWTHGGTLRDIPVGGGTRKTAKRSRTSSSTTPTQTHTHTHLGLDPIPASHVYVPTQINPMTNGNGTPVSSSFTSLLSMSSGGPGGLLALGGFGLGLGLDDVGFGLGRGVWAFPEVGYENGSGSGSVASEGTMNRGGDTWQGDHESGGENGFGHHECFPSLPELAISTPSIGNALK